MVDSVGTLLPERSWEISPGRSGAQNPPPFDDADLDAARVSGEVIRRLQDAARQSPEASRQLTADMRPGTSGVAIVREMSEAPEASWPLASALARRLKEVPPDQLTQLLELLQEVPPDQLTQLLEVLRIPAVRALLTPPTELEMEVEALVKGEQKPVEYYPRDRVKGKEPSPEFVERVYGRYVRSQCLYLDQVKTIDQALYVALHGYATNCGTVMSAYIPAEKQKTDKYVEGIPDYLAKRLEFVGPNLRARRQYKESAR